MSSKEEGQKKEDTVDIRAVLTGKVAEEYIHLKKLIGTNSDPETIRVIIHQYYELIKEDERILKLKS